MKYRCIVADPPWQYAEKVHMGTGPKHKGPSEQYGLMNLADIKALPVSDWAEPAAHLYLWTTNTFMVEGYDVARAWGFEPRTIVTWVKDQMGTGYYFRGTTEHVIFAVRGKLPPRRRDLPTHFTGKRRSHSEKPDGLLYIAEQMSPGPRLEMFARRRRDGWDVWGNQAPEIAQTLLEAS